MEFLFFSMKSGWSSTTRIWLMRSITSRATYKVPNYEGSKDFDLGNEYVSSFFPISFLILPIFPNRSVLTDNVDELLQDTNKFNMHYQQRQVVKQQQEKQKYIQKRVSYLFIVFFHHYRLNLIIFPSKYCSESTR